MVWVAAVMERATNAVAGAAVVSPWWLPSMTQLSHGATIALPILGCAWLLIQIYFKVTEKR